MAPAPAHAPRRQPDGLPDLRVGSFVAAAVLRLALTTDLQVRRALRASGWGFVVLGLGLMPAGLGEAAVHPLAQWLMTAGSLSALAMLAQSKSLLQARPLPKRWTAVAIAASATVCAAALAIDRWWLGQVYPFGMSVMSLLILWCARGFIVRPRDATERLLGLTWCLLAVSMVLRFGFTLFHTGPLRVDLLYVPAAAGPPMAAMYGVVPMVVATFLLNLVNARLRQPLNVRAQTDELTGTLTRRALRELAPALIDMEQLRQRSVAVMMLDLDRFKAINDTHGHAAGDAVLQAAAAVLRAQTRSDGLLAR
jgi:hypothetical protein